MIEVIAWIYGIGVALHIVLVIALFVTDPFGYGKPDTAKMVFNAIVLPILWPVILARHVWQEVRDD